MFISDKGFWCVNLDEEAAARSEPGAAPIFAAPAHSDLRGQIYNLAAGADLTIPHEKWPLHLFLVLGISGSVEAEIRGRKLPLRAHSQLVILPGVPCRLTASSPAAIEVISLRSHRPPGVLG